MSNFPTEVNGTMKKIIDQYIDYRDRKWEDWPDAGPLGKKPEPIINLLHEAYRHGIDTGLGFKNKTEVTFNLGLTFVSQEDIDRDGPVIKVDNPTRPIIVKAHLIHIFPKKLTFWSKLQLARNFLKHLNKYYKNDKNNY